MVSGPDAGAPVLCVCTGNLCRSPYLASRLQTLAPRQPVASAGVQAVVGAPMDPPMAEALRQRGADPTDFRSRLLTRDLIADAALILTATQAHRDAVAALHPGAVNKVFTVAQAAQIIPRLDPRPGDLPALVAALAAGRWLVRTDPTDDIADPLGGSAEDYQRCVTTLDDAAAIIADALAH